MKSFDDQGGWRVEFKGGPFDGKIQAVLEQPMPTVEVALLIGGVHMRGVYRLTRSAFSAFVFIASWVAPLGIDWAEYRAQ